MTRTNVFASCATLLLLRSIAMPTAQSVSDQADRITIRTIPAPDAVVFTQVTQDVTMNAESPPDRPVALVGKTNLAGTMRVGSATEQGHAEAQYTLDSFNTSITVDGVPRPAVNVDQNLVGRTYSMTFDDADNGVDMQAPMLRPLLLAAFFGLPTVTLAIAESTTVRRQVRLPILPPGPLVDATLDSTYTLQSVSTETAGRIAHLSISTAGGIERDFPLPTTVTVSGSGTMDVNIDAGYVLRQETATTFDAVVNRSRVVPHPQPTIYLHGTIRMTSQVQAQ
jgi:hypothetical protein